MACCCRYSHNVQCRSFAVFKLKTKCQLPVDELKTFFVLKYSNT